MVLEKPPRTMTGVMSHIRLESLFSDKHDYFNFTNNDKKTQKYNLQASLQSW